MNLEGKLLGNRYEIIKKVGNGGMATVYKAKDKILKRDVAVKILRDEFTTDEEFIKRFEVEAQSAARLTHANIVSIYDVGVDGNLYFIVMELIQGKTLKEIILEEQGPLPWKWSINVAIQIAQALEMAHRNNIIHRDIKPHNIIITEDGVAKVTDFGIAKAVSNSTITAFGTTIGSVHYFSPEHARGGYTDAKSDLYSLGVVMYEMLTGKVPFDADTPVSVALKHMQEEPVEPIELNPNMPSSVNKIIMKALKKEPSLRYQSSTEMLIDLKAALKDPEGDFVEEKEYDKTANTQKLHSRDKDEKSGKKQNKFIALIKNHSILSLCVGLILLFFLIFGGMILFFGKSGPKDTKVPNVIGLTEEEAKKQVEAANLEFVKESEDYNNAEAGKVFAYKTEISDYKEVYSSTTAKEKSKIYVKISKGPKKVQVPNVEGKEKAEAIKILETAELKYEVVEENSDTVEAGYVISQETEPDKEVNVGEKVKIHVSKGKEKVTMISVVDKDEEEAKQALKDIGITNIVTVTEENSSKETGKVIRQSIENGSVIDKDSTVTITVNSYVAARTVTLVINVANLTGYTEPVAPSANETNTTNTTSTQTGVKRIDVSVTMDDRIVATKPSDNNNKALEIQVTGTGTKTLTINAGGYTSPAVVNFSEDTRVEVK